MTDLEARLFARLFAAAALVALGATAGFAVCGWWRSALAADVLAGVCAVGALHAHWRAG